MVEQLVSKKQEDKENVQGTEPLQTVSPQPIQ